MIPQELVDRELGHGGVTKLHVVGSLHERKALMAELADGFVALPGGFGTLDELLEQLTWSQLGLHAKPIGLLDVEGYWGPLIALARHATDEGFVREADLAAIAVADDPEALLDSARAPDARGAPAAKWSTAAGALSRGWPWLTTPRASRAATVTRSGDDARAQDVLSQRELRDRRARGDEAVSTRAAAGLAARTADAPSNVEVEDVGERLRRRRADVVDRRPAGRAPGRST